MATPSSTAAFAPADRPSVAVAADGTLAAIQEPGSVTIVEIPSCAPFAELGLDGDAAGSDIAWVGTPPRLVVLSRYATHSSVHLVDPLGPRSIAEIRLEASMRIVAAVGSHAVVAGASGVAILQASDRSLTPHQFPARAVPVAAGAAGANVVVAQAGAIEEWDPQTRMPKRRLKLPRPASITAVGGSDRVVWLTTQQEPARLDVIPLVNRGQPKGHDLPEPIAAVSSHPRCDIVVCVGAATGRIFVVDLDGRSSLRVVSAPGIDRADAAGLVLGRVVGVLAAQAGRAATVVSIEGADEAADSTAAPPPAAVRKSAVFGGAEHAVEPPTTVTISSPPLAPSAPAADVPGSGPSAEPSRPSRQVLPPPFAASDKLQAPAGASAASASSDRLQAPTGPSMASAHAASSDKLQPPGELFSTPGSASSDKLQPPGALFSTPGSASSDKLQPPGALFSMSSSPRLGSGAAPAPPAKDSRAVAETQPFPFTSSGVPMSPSSELRTQESGNRTSESGARTEASGSRAAETGGMLRAEGSGRQRSSISPPIAPPVADARAIDDTQPPALANAHTNEDPRVLSPANTPRGSIAPPVSDARAIDDTQPPAVSQSHPRASTPPPTRRDARAVAETQLPSFGQPDGEVDSKGVPLLRVNDGRAVDDTQPIQSFAAPPQPARQPRGPSVPPPVTDARAVDDTVPPPLVPSASAPSAAIAGRGSVAHVGRPALDELRGEAAQFRAFRERMEHPRARTDVPLAGLWPDAPPDWRDDLVAWALRVRGGEVEPPPASPVDMLATRFDLSGLQGVAVARLYAEHLLGSDGIAPIDVAKMFERDGDSADHWSDALGRGDLARHNLATYIASRVRLAEVVLRALDEVPPRTGVLVGPPGIVSLLGACAIVADGPLPIIAEACVPSIGGAILAAHPASDPAELVAEARVYGAAALWRVRAELLARIPAESPIILVVDDDLSADQLGVPRLT